MGQKVWPRPKVAKTFAKRNNITNAKSDTPSSFHVARVDVATFSTKLLKVGRAIVTLVVWFLTECPDVSTNLDHALGQTRSNC